LKSIHIKVDGVIKSPYFNYNKIPANQIGLLNSRENLKKKVLALKTGKGVTIELSRGNLIKAELVDRGEPYGE
jgi:hypothetical protein